MINLYFMSMILLTYLLSFYILMNMSILLSFSLILVFKITFFSWSSFNFILIFDFFSIIFLMTVLWISLSVFLFSLSYMAHDKYFNRFHFLLSFVISMMLLILSGLLMWGV